MAWIERHWYRRTPVSVLLWPFAALYSVLAVLRFAAYGLGILRSTRVPVPVIVVGNITVGGTGKTPLVVWLVQSLKARGYRPGVVTRGYRGAATSWPQTVLPNSNPAFVGDEPVLIARSVKCPVVADPDRVRAARSLVQLGCDVIVSDDGLQHYRLARDVEIAVVDGERRFGNGWCLPAGPLREPILRLGSVDFRVVQGGVGPEEWAMTLESQEFRRLDDAATADLNRFRGKTVHALAGIGHPPRFFSTLRRLGVSPIEHPFPDHHLFRADELQFADDLDIVMTEKDAVKCRSLGVTGWYLAIVAKPDPGFAEAVLYRMKENIDG